MFLCSGIDDNNNLIYIDQVTRGKTNLKCPYCGGFLTAKKGKTREHHFAHTGESCQAVSQSNNLYLPLFDSFTLNLTREEFKQLRRYHYQKERISKTIFTRLIEKGILNFGGNFCSLTKLGKIVFSELSLPLFAEIQNELILKKLYQLEKNATLAYENNSIDFPDLLADFQKYKAQFKRVLSQTLYFMRLKLDGNEYYKIGTVQSISVEDVKKNIEEKTEKYFSSREIEIIGEWENRGSLKPYFYHRYNFYKCGLLDINNILDISGCFMFSRSLDPDYAKKIVREIQRIPLKYLSPQERAILNDELFEIEQGQVLLEKKEQFSTAVKTGMERAKHWGVHIGRPSDSTESTEKFLAKPKQSAIALCLKKGLSLRQTAKETGVSVNTVRKVKAALENDLTTN